MNNVLKGVVSFLMDILETVVIALSIFVVVYLLAFQPHEVKGQSMDGEGGFHDGQYILTDKLTYRFRDPQNGEVVVFKYPLNKNVDYIKRIIAIPGDEIMILNNKVYLYKAGAKEPTILDEQYLYSDAITQGKTYLQEGQKIRISEDEYFVMGDNREQSSDSRSWGLVPKENIIGRSFFVYWPPNDIGLVDHVEY